MEYKKDFSREFSLDKKAAIVTGAANGIGKAISIMYALKGARLLLADCCEVVEKVEKEIREAGGEASSVVGDITIKSVRESIAEKCVEKYGGIDILANVAGVALLADAESISEDDWDRTFDTNLRASFMLSQIVGRRMIEQKSGGKIINLASDAAVIALDKHIAYCASKSALVSMTRVLAVEWAEFGITINAISPTVVLTERGEKAWAGQKGIDKISTIPVRRFAYPDEIAACAVYLASDAADMITGANIMIDGGYTAQ